MLLGFYTRVATFLAGLRQRATDERGVTAVEYGVIAALIIAVLVGIIATLGQQLLTAFTKVSSGIP